MVMWELWIPPSCGSITFSRFPYAARERARPIHAKPFCANSIGQNSIVWPHLNCEEGWGAGEPTVCPGGKRSWPSKWLFQLWMDLLSITKHRTYRDLFFFFFVFLKLHPHPRHVDVSSLGSCSHRPTPEPQQLSIRAQSSKTYTTAHGKARSLTHWARPGIESASSGMLAWFVNHWSMMGTPQDLFFQCT